MKVPSRAASRPDRIVCPACGSRELRVRGSAFQRLRGSALVGCDSCGSDVDGAVFRTLEQIVALPDAAGSHACECGHPEMRLLPEGVFHCPACRSEVLPLEVFPGQRAALEAPARKPEAA